MNKNKHQIWDWPLFITTCLLITIGTVMLFSTSPVVGYSTYNDSYFFIKRFFIFFLIGIPLFIAGYLIPYKHYQKFAFSGLLFSILLLLLTFAPSIGRKIGGASRWINLYFFQLQPVEICKFFITVFLAAAFANKKKQIQSFFKGILPLLLIISIPILLLGLQPDLGNIVVILIVTFSLLFLSKAKIKHLLIFAFIGISLISINIFMHPYQITRIQSFLTPWADPLGKNYHTVQSFTAIGSGGFLGNGLGQSKLKYFYLPLHYSDFIYAIICEEGGFILASILLFLFTFLFFRGLKIALFAKNTFAYFLALGLSLFLVVQAFINIGVVIGVLPTTGIPLTFISYGGTSLLTSIFFISVILNISKSQ